MLWLLLVERLIVILLATPGIVVHTLPCRQMTTVHHAGVGSESKPTRMIESGWIMLVVGARR